MPPDMTNQSTCPKNGSHRPVQVAGTFQESKGGPQYMAGPLFILGCGPGFPLK